MGTNSTVASDLGCLKTKKYRALDQFQDLYDDELEEEDDFVTNLLEHQKLDEGYLDHDDDDLEDDYFESRADDETDNGAVPSVKPNDITGKSIIQAFMKNRI